MVGNCVVETNSSQALQVSEYDPDITRPELRAFDLDVDSGNLTLTFSETVNVTSLDVTQITLNNGIENDDRMTLDPTYVL